MTLSQYGPYGSLWTSRSHYIIDFQRGLVTHSKTLTKGQANRYLGDRPKILQRPDLNSRQAFHYFSTYILAQKYLNFIHQQHQNELSKLFFQSSLSYISNHKQQFQKLQNKLAYPMRQIPYGGFVRSSLERDNLVNYVNKIKEKTILYGMKTWQKFQKNHAAERTYKTLKDIAFKSRENKIIEENTEE